MRLRDRTYPAHRLAYLSWAAVALIVITRLANFWGLHYGSTDDIAVDFNRITMPFWTIAHDYAIGQSRVQFFLTAPLWVGMMRLAGTLWYDLLNLGFFALGALLPPFALRKYYFPGDAFLLYAVAFFAPLPLLFSYTPPYSYPLYTSLPLAACGMAVIFFEGSQRERGEWRLAAGAVATFLAVCAYESATVLSIVILGAYFAASHSGRPWKTILQRRDLWCAAGAIACFGALYFAFRAAHPPNYEGVQASAEFLTPSSVTRVVGALSLTSSVYAWFIAPQRTFDAPLRAELSLERATIPEIALAFLTAAAVFGWIVRSIGNKGRPNPLTLAVLAIVLLIAPNAAYALIPKIASLVLSGQLYAYTSTPYSQMGFACAFVALSLGSVRIQPRPLRILVAGILAVFAGCGSLAASGFNRESGVLARQQTARWKVIKYLASCSSQIPAAYLQNLTAPRMWKTTTALMSWVERDRQEESYWDELAFNRYGLRVHLVAEPVDESFHLLDFRLGKDGSLNSVILARTSDGKRFDEGWLIPAPCRNGLHALRLTGVDFERGSFTPLEPAALLSGARKSAAIRPALKPRSGSGSDQIFRVSLLPAEHGEAVELVGLLINGMKTGVGGCFVYWDLKTHEARLVNDNGEESKPIGPAGVIGNRQCDLLLAGTTFSADANNVELTCHLKFHDTFKGPKQMFLIRYYAKGRNSDLNRIGWWMIE